MAMQVVTPFKEGIQAIVEAGGEFSTLCYECGACNTVCPYGNLPTSFSPRKVIRQAQFGLTEVESEETWLCTTCNACVERCPRGVAITDVMVAARRIAAEWGNAPKSLESVRASLVAEGNPWGEMRANRADWASGASAPIFKAGTELLYFPCCAQSYDVRVRKTAIATAEVLNKAGVSYGILGTEENCCGESIRRTGYEELYERLAKDNIKTFVERGVQKIVASSPHCYQSFHNQYPQFRVNFDVVHMSQLLLNLIDEGRLTLRKDYGKRVVYHDPCYLGRHNGIYDAPRQLLKRIRGLELVEMRDNRENAMCCGGGGGRIWMESLKGERLSDLRFEQAKKTEATVLATFCPYCILNFESSRLAVDGGEAVEVKDVVEIIQEVI